MGAAAVRQCGSESKMASVVNYLSLLWGLTAEKKTPPEHAKVVVAGSSDLSATRGPRQGPSRENIEHSAALQDLGLPPEALGRSGGLGYAAFFFC